MKDLGIIGTMAAARRTLAALALLGAIAATPQVSASQDCETAQRYAQLAAKSLEAFDTAEAIKGYQRAADACGTYGNWQKLGETAASDGARETALIALEAFSQAYAKAQTVEELAVTKAAYADVFFQHFDRSQAVDLAFEARNLDPSNTAVAAAATTLLDESKSLTGDDVKRGLGGMGFKPPPLRNQLDRTIEGGSSDLTGGAAAQPVLSAQINFLFNSVELDAETAPNVAVLAEQLASDDFSGKSFLFIGHADRRGAEADNLALSQRRAAAVRDRVLLLKPELAGRVKFEGKGEAEPRSFGSTEADHRANRRLEVIPLN